MNMKIVIIAVHESNSAISTAKANALLGEVRMFMPLVFAAFLTSSSTVTPSAKMIKEVSQSAATATILIFDIMFFPFLNTKRETLYIRTSNTRGSTLFIL